MQQRPVTIPCTLALPGVWPPNATAAVLWQSIIPEIRHVGDAGTGIALGGV